MQFEARGVREAASWMHMPTKGTIYRVSVSMGARVFFDTTSAELEKAGYKFDPVAECMAMVTWDGKTRSVTCDAPIVNAGTETRPVVVSNGSSTRLERGSATPPAHSAPDYLHPIAY